MRYHVTHADWKARHRVECRAAHAFHEGDSALVTTDTSGAQHSYLLVKRVPNDNNNDTTWLAAAWKVLGISCKDPVHIAQSKIENDPREMRLPLYCLRQHCSARETAPPPAAKDTVELTPPIDKDGNNRSAHVIVESFYHDGTPGPMPTYTVPGAPCWRNADMPPPLPQNAAGLVTPQGATVLSILSRCRC